ncbi:MAG: SOS response-associated peptidase [Gammaproteobacteria bacterium]
MCGRYALHASAEELQARLSLSGVPDFAPRYNLTPSQQVPAILVRDGVRELVPIRWGLVPHWARDPRIGWMVNARSETVADKPVFRNAFRRRRCLIPASGYYEWRVQIGAKRPYYIHLADTPVFAFAGLWENWQRDGPGIDSCTIITTEANDILRPIHERMPVILAPGQYRQWLDPTEQDAGVLLEMLRPYPGPDTRAYPVTTRVNNPRYDDAACMLAIAAETPDRAW